jgi:hypothetical protein
MRFKESDIVYLFTIADAAMFLFLVNWTFPDTLDYLFIIVVSFYIVEYVMNHFDRLSERWNFYHVKFLLLMTGIIVSTLAADIWLHLEVQLLNNYPRGLKELFAALFEVLCVMATMNLRETDKSR